MKYILFIYMHSWQDMTITAEFNSLASCNKAGYQIFKEMGVEPKSRHSKFICVAKGLSVEEYPKSELVNVNQR